MAHNRQTHHVLDQLDAELKSFVPAEVKDIRSGNGPSLYPHEAKSANFSIAKFSKAKDDYEHRKKREKTDYENAENYLARVCAEKEYNKRKRAGTIKRTIIVVSILLLIAFGLYMLIANVIWPSIYKNKLADDLYTPELVQTYEGIISSGSFKGGQEFITITSCDKNGAVTGYVEMITKDNLYANYAITGQISDKKNSGDLTITFKHGDWIVQPDGWTFLKEEFTVNVRDNYQTMTGDFSLSANSAYADAEDLYAPEILASYISANNNGTQILTVTLCDQSGNVDATWEILRNDDSYMKVRLRGYIAAKKNNGLVVVVWTSNEVERAVGSSGSWNDETYAFFTENGSVVNTDTGVSFTVGEHTANTIKTVEDLQKLSNSSGYYVLKNDIDLSGVNWVPIQGFTGVLEGNGYTIKNMSIIAYDGNAGFFGELAGIVNNLSFENAQVVVSGYQENVGILCGKLSGEATNITTSGTVTASGCANVGGIAGLVEKAGAYSLSNLINNANVIGSNYVGGIFGKVYNYYTHYNPEEVSLERLENSGAITGSGNYVGGIAGYLHMEGGHDYITLYGSSMKNTGTIKGKQYVGGVLGYGFTDSAASYLQDCSSSAAISAECYVGGIAGYLSYITINDCSNAGSSITATGYETSNGVKYAYVGGYVGYGYLANSCTNAVDINYTAGGDCVGGIMGYTDVSSECTMRNLKNTATISGSNYVGGIFGNVNYDSKHSVTLNTMENTGAISGANYVGGIFGKAYYYCSSYSSPEVTLNNMNNSGAITGSGNYVGGIAGYLHMEGGHDYITLYGSSMKNTGTIKGKQYVGGLFGYIMTDSSKSSVIDITATGAVTGTSDYGKKYGYAENITFE